MSKKRVNIAASVVAQASARAEAASEKAALFANEPVPLHHKTSYSVIHSRIDETSSPETGKPRLVVVFPGKDKPELHDFTALLVQPEIGRFLAEGFRYWSFANSPLSRRNGSRCIRIYIYRFLASLPVKQSLMHINETFWTTFLLWVNGPRKKCGQPWAESTRARIHGTFLMCIQALLEHPDWGNVASHLLNRTGFPLRPWRGRSTKAVPTKIMSPTERRAMILACLSELADLRERLEKRDKTLKHGQAILKEALDKGQAPPYRDEIGVCAARIAEAFPTKLVSKSAIKSFDQSLYYALDSKHTLNAVRRLLYSHSRDLVPFVLLIGVKSAFNPDTLFSLTWSRIWLSQDESTITIAGVKGRAADLQINISSTQSDAGDLEVPYEKDVPFAFADLLDLLRRLTARTSALFTDPDHADRLFIGVSKQGDCRASTLDRACSGSSSATWWEALNDFIKNHNLAPFTLASLRFSEGEMEWRRTGDLLAVRDRLGHKSIITTRTHYTSDGMRRESQERVAEIQVLHHRWLQSEGRIDPRKQPEPWRPSATPGFGCMQPFDSPRPGQRKGRLCDAYGECPDCPMAQAWPQDVQAAAYYAALPRAIHDALLGRISARQWVDKWPPVLESLDKLLCEIPPKVRAEASKFHVVLKPVG